MSATPDELPTDATPCGPRELQRLLGPEHRALTVGILAVVSLVAFEAMAVATAMPVAARDLGGLRLYAWGFSAFLTTSLLGMVVSGEVSDRRGPLLPFVVAVVTFGVGLLVAGTATTMAMFIAGRAVQGFGAGLNVVVLYVVVGRTYPDALRPRLFSAMASAWVLPAIVGPSIAGLVADALSWRWVFLAVPPLIVPAVALLLPRLARLGAVAVDRRSGRGRTLPALAAAVGVGLLQYSGQRLAVSSLVLLGVAAALLVPSVPRLLPRGTLAAGRGLPSAILMRGILAGSFFGAETFVPLMLVEERGQATALAGLALTGAAVSWSVGAWVQGRPRTTVPRFRLVQWGSGLVGAGIALVSLALWPALPPLVAGAGWAVAGLGMGLSLSSVNVMTLDLSPESEHGFSSAALQVSDALGSIVFIGLGGAIFAGLHDRGHGGAGAFLLIYAVMAVVALAGAAVAPRVRPEAAVRTDLAELAGV